MSTLTRTRGLRGILDDLPARGLPIPAPAGRVEEVVADALEALEKAHAKDRKKAEDIIEKHGLTIEVARLREKLARAATSDLQRLLLSTPGVPESLFLEAIAKQLDDEEESEKRAKAAVRDDSVDVISKKLDKIATQLEKLTGGGSTGASSSVPAKPSSSAPTSAARSSRSSGQGSKQ